MTPAENEIRGAYEVAVARLNQIQKSIEAMREQERLIILRIKDCEAAGRIFDISFPPIQGINNRPTVCGNVREFTIDRLRNAHGGIKAPDITAAYKESFGRELHPKTIGMTLYRIKKDGMARREGRVWFYLPPSSEQASPEITL